MGEDRKGLNRPAKSPLSDTPQKKRPAKWAEKTSQRLQDAVRDEDLESPALLGLELVLSGSTKKALKAARSFTPREELPIPRTKKGIVARVVITTLIDEARDEKKTVSLTSSKVRDILAGRWRGKKPARKIGIEVMRRAAKLCNVLLIGTVPGDLRGTLQLTGEGPELRKLRFLIFHIVTILSGLEWVIGIDPPS